MGGDHGPQVLIDGAMLGLQANPAITELFLVGDKSQIEAGLTGGKCCDRRIQVVHASEVLTMNETQTATTQQMPAPDSDSAASKKAQETQTVKFWTPQFDARFPNTNQTRRCWQNYVDYFKCLNATDGDEKACEIFQKTYRSLCPNEWV